MIDDKYLPKHSYEVPPCGDVLYTVSFSGGRSSAYMLYKFLEANRKQGLPIHYAVIFANTGKEHPATLDFVREVGRRWKVRIHWVEYRYHAGAKGGAKDPRHRHKVVNYDTASREGEPYQSLIEGRGGYLPNKMQRICTMELKVATMRRFIQRDLGYKHHEAFLGIRYDEPKRWMKIMLTDTCRNHFPMVTAKVTREDVLKFWSEQDFDLKTPALYGNCDLCFLKGRRKLVEGIKKEPFRADWWIEQEQNNLLKNKHRLSKPENAQFILKESYRELKNSALQEPVSYTHLTLPTIYSV